MSVAARHDARAARLALPGLWGAKFRISVRSPCTSVRLILWMRHGF